ncbi:cation diffusion facilitator family transporter [Bacteroidales bacterium OttesenSCG-928-M06]|nr:cation diffusion facilitator family transporter [Bacteroidales bacterium OttesenSCG-928-M06]MDL2256932.1 cation diffusion facilitator family transporter [Bacteroidales bacterium OttesenSCG-928-I14]MDL2323045.1 cation diffusion facilitator family transporter [Bacteroidales bacterium OttesenSCG-928-A17]
MGKTRTQKAQQVTLLGAIVNVLLSIGKILAGFIGKSSAMIADGIHSLSDLITDAIVIIFFRISDAEKDDKHPYGHGKFETFSTFLIALVLFGVGLGIFYGGISSILSVIRGEVLPKPQMIAFWFALISIICKEGLFWYTKKVGKQINSQSIIANAWHHRTDAFSSIGVAIGIAGAIFLGDKWTVLDPIAGVIVSLFIIKTAVELSLPSIQELMESSLPKEIVQKIEMLIMDDDKIRSFHKLRTRKIGDVFVIDVHIQLENTISLEQAHSIAGALSRRIREVYGNKTQINIHMEPSDENCH